MEVVDGCNDYFAGNPIELGLVRTTDPGSVEININVRRSVPETTWMKASEAIHQARSALDNAVYAIAVGNGANEDDLSRAFLIELVRGAYYGSSNSRGARERRLRGVPESQRQVIDQSQPFQNGIAAARHPLAIIRSSSNRDKHRKGNRAIPVVFGVGVNVIVGGIPVVTYAPYQGDFRVFDGQPGGVPVPMSVEPLGAELSGMRVGIAFAPSGWQTPDLQNAVDFADTVVRRLATADRTS